MTRKHFIAIAAAMAKLKDSVFIDESSPEFKATCAAIADVCELQNPRFNRDKFLAACEAPHVS